MAGKKPMTTVAGLATARGFASGPVFVYRGDGEIPVPEYIIEPGRESEELLRLQRARYETQRDLEGLISVLKERTGKDDVRVFECHLMMLEDSVLRKETESYIKNDRLNAEAAVKKTFANARATFERMNDPYFRERVRDLDDIERRLENALTGFSTNPHLELKEPSIVVADDLTPSETVQLPREFLLGFATNGGSTTSHVALLARALAIPAVVGLGDITSRVSAGETVLLDGTAGTVTLDPDDATRAQFETLMHRQKELARPLPPDRPAGTLKSGGEIILHANVHPGIPFDIIKTAGARGIGLYRSEYLWIGREFEPTEEEQYVAYRFAIETAKTLGPDARTAIRLLDIGGDKLVKGISAKEANPFLGNRSIRYLLSHRDVFRTQLRAALRASAHGPAAIMYPMISVIDELRECSVMLAETKRELDEAGIAYDRNLPVGMMIEIPSAALNARRFAKYVDFFSIGTNDLIQYTMAADRGNDSVSHLYQPMNFAILELVGRTVAAAKEAGIHVAVCGESASYPITGLYWAALGVDTLSMSASFIPVMAKLLGELTREDLDEYAKIPGTLPENATNHEIICACRDWLAAKLPGYEDLLV